MANPFAIRAMTQYTISGQNYIAVIHNGAIYLFNGSTASVIPGDTLDTSGPCHLVVANDVLYAIDASGALFSTTGTLTSTVTLLNAADENRGERLDEAARPKVKAKAFAANLLKDLKLKNVTIDKKVQDALESAVAAK